MASRVNVKFVLILSAALTVVFIGVAGVALWVLSNTGPELERQGDELMDAGDYEAAQKTYGKSYNHDRSNIAVLDKYIDALEAWTPDKPVAYRDAYQKLLAAYQTRATTIMRTDVDAHEEFLKRLYQYVNLLPSRNGWNELAEQTRASLGYFENDPTAGSDWHRLRRYRGIALVEIMNLAGADESSTTPRGLSKETAEEDLIAALGVNPDDTKAVIQLSRFNYLTAVELQTLRRTEDEADRRFQAAAEIIDDYVASHPKDAAALAYQITLSYMFAARELDPDLRGPALIEANRQIAESFGDDVTTFLDLLQATPPEDVEFDLIAQAWRLELLTTDELPSSTLLIDKVLATRGNDPLLLDARARLARQARDHEKADALYSRIVEMKRPSVSVDGIILLTSREIALVARTEVALAIWEQAQESEKAGALKLAEDYLEEVKANLVESDPRLALLNGKIEFAKGNYVEAQRHLAAYHELAGGRDPNVLLMLADISLRASEYGTARDLLRDLVALQPQNPAHYLSLARVEIGLNDRAAARTYIDLALEVDPENPDAVALLTELEGIENPSLLTDSDPARAALISAQSLALGKGIEAPDLLGAIAVLDEAITSLSGAAATDAEGLERLVVQRIQFLSATGNRTLALEQARQWTQTFPDSENLQALELGLTAPDTLAGEFAVIDAGSDPEYLKLVKKYYACLRRDDPRQASEVIAQARSLAPDEPLVLDAAFADALTHENFQDAQQLADQAASVNLDRMGGQSYQARIQVAKGDIADAITTLRQATQSPTAPAFAWRLLGAYQAELGRSDDAIKSLRQAQRKSPNDVTTLVAYIQVLGQFGDRVEALRVARDNQSIGSQNSRFIEMWLELEASDGDPNVAIVRREEIQNRLPEYRPNTLALIALYISENRLDQARALLDKIQDQESDLAVVDLNARVYGKQGEVVSGRAVFEEYIAAQQQSDDGATFADFAAYASFLLNMSQFDDAIATLELARPVQDPVLREADTTIGRLLHEQGRYAEAIESLERAVASGSDETRLTLAESLINVGRVDEARRVIEESDEAWNEKLLFLIAMSKCESASGNAQRAIQLATEAATRFGKSPIPFIQRATLLVKDESLINDALADLNTAIYNDPNHWVALSMRAELYDRLGDRTKALVDLRNAVRANPTLSGERRVLVQSLIRSGRVLDAVAIADEAVESRPNDLDLAIGMGDVFASERIWDRASIYFSKAWDIAPSKSTGMRYVASLIRMERPLLPDAERVLAHPICDTENSPGMLILRASLRMKQGDPNTARRDAAGAVALATQDLATASRVLEDLNTVFPDNPEATANFILQQDLSALPGRGKDYFRAIAMMQIPDRYNEGLDLLRILATDESDPVIISNSRRLLIMQLLNPARGEYAEALVLLKAAHEADPEDWSFANNIAFVLSKEMDQPDEALVYAKKAFAVAPNASAVLDTLGYVYRRLKRYDEAEQSLERALDAANSDAMRVTVMLHMGQLMVEQARKADAQALIRQIEAILTAQEFPVTNNQEFVDLKSQVDALP